MDLQDELQEIWKRHSGDVAARIRACEDAARAALDGELDDTLRMEAKSAAHKLAGLVGMFGFKAAGETAGRMELMLESPLTSEDAARLAKWVTDLRRELEAPSAPAQTGAGSSKDGLLLIDDDPAFRAAFEASATARGVRCHLGVDLAGIEALRREHPHELMFLDLGLPEGKDAVLEYIAAEAQRCPYPPIVVLSATPTMADRVACAKSGVRAFLAKGMAVEDLMAEVEVLLRRHRTQRGAIVVLDDDAAVLEAVRAILGPQGFDVHTAQEPELFWNLVQQHRPRLILLDHNMPDAQGTDIALALRNERGFRQPHIIFMTAGEATSLGSTYDALEDVSFFAKPVNARALAGTVMARMEALDDASGRAASGLASMSSLDVQGPRLANLAARYSEPLSLGIITFPGIELLKDASVREQALSHMGRRVRTQFGPEAHAVAWGDHGVAITQLGVTNEAMRQSLRELARGLQENPGPVDDGAWTEPALAYRGFAAGDRWTSFVDATQQGLHALDEDRAEATGPSTIDIALVDDDDVIQEIMGQAVAGRDWTIQTFANGTAAKHALLGEPPKVTPRVILLDVNLPGTDGLTLLRRLMEQPHTKRIPVIMVTRRSNEDEVLESLNAGAADHISKPFSVPVVLSKLSKHLED